MALLSVLLIMMVYSFPMEESIRTARFSPLHLSTFTTYLLSPVYQQLVSFHSPHTSCSLFRARVSFILLFSLWLFSLWESPLFCLPLRSQKWKGCPSTSWVLGVWKVGILLCTRSGTPERASCSSEGMVMWVMPETALEKKSQVVKIDNIYILLCNIFKFSSFGLQVNSKVQH